MKTNVITLLFRCAKCDGHQLHSYREGSGDSFDYHCKLCGAYYKKVHHIDNDLYISYNVVTIDERCGCGCCEDCDKEARWSNLSLALDAIPQYYED